MGICFHVLKPWKSDLIGMLFYQEKTGQEIGKSLSRKHNQIEGMNEWKWEKKSYKEIYLRDRESFSFTTQQIMPQSIIASWIAKVKR